MKSEKKYIVGWFLVLAVVIMAMYISAYISWETEMTDNSADRIIRVLVVFSLFFLTAVGVYFLRESAKEDTRKAYENKPFSSIEDLKRWTHYKVFLMLKLKLEECTLFLLGPAGNNLEKTELRDIIYYREQDHRLPKDIKVGCVIAREEYDKIFIKEKGEKKA